MKKVNDIQAKRGGCKTCPPATNKYNIKALISKNKRF